MPGYIVTVAASAGLAFFIQTTAAQHQPVSPLTVGAVAQSSANQNNISFGTGSDGIMATRSLVAVPTPSGVLESKNERKIRIAQAVGTAGLFTFLLFIILSALNVVNFAIWLPALPALVGLIAVAGAHIDRLAKES